VLPSVPNPDQLLVPPLLSGSCSNLHCRFTQLSPGMQRSMPELRNSVSPTAFDTCQHAQWVKKSVLHSSQHGRLGLPASFRKKLAISSSWVLLFPSKLILNSCRRNMLTAQKSLTSRAVARTSGARISVRRAPVQSRRRALVTHALNDTNFFLNLITSGACGAMAAAVTLVTAENTDKEVSRSRTPLRSCGFH
jgi:hypothetical protein